MMARTMISGKPLLQWTLQEMLVFLEKVYDSDEPCGCDTAYPWRTCNGCLAGGALNDAGALLRSALRELKTRGVNMEMP